MNGMWTGMKGKKVFSSLASYDFCEYILGIRTLMHLYWLFRFPIPFLGLPLFLSWYFQTLLLFFFPILFYRLPLLRLFPPFCQNELYGKKIIRSLKHQTFSTLLHGIQIQKRSLFLSPVQFWMNPMVSSTVLSIVVSVILMTSFFSLSFPVY